MREFRKPYFNIFCVGVKHSFYAPFKRMSITGDQNIGIRNKDIWT